jgi:hypothetical protein
MSFGGPGEEQRLDLRSREACELGLVAVEEPPAAAHAALRHDRHAGAAQRVHVAQDRPFRALEALREHTSRHSAGGLQQQQDR